jgi:hypothetical protein
VTPIYSQNNFGLFTLSGPIFGPTFGGVLSALETPDGYYESAINNIYASNVGTARIYTTFSGIAKWHLTLPTIFQRTEDSLPGWTLVERAGRASVRCRDREKTAPDRTTCQPRNRPVDRPLR